MYGLAMNVSQTKKGDFKYVDAVQCRLKNDWFGESKFCLTTALRKVIQWKKASEVVLRQLRYG